MRPSPTYSPTARFKKNYFVEKPYLLSWVLQLVSVINVNFVYSAAVDWTAEVEGEIELIF